MKTLTRQFKDITEILGEPKKKRLIRIPYDLFIKNGKAGSSRVKCARCQKIKRVKHMAMMKGRILCSDCRSCKDGKN